MTFEEWWVKYCGPVELGASHMSVAMAAWQAAQQSERERILKIVEQVGIQGNHNEWFDCCDTIVERIGK